MMEAYRLDLLEEIAENTRGDPNRFDRFRKWCRGNRLRLAAFVAALAAAYAVPTLVEVSGWRPCSEA